MLVEIVCHANVCRSPVAAGLLAASGGWKVRSSGLRAVPGQHADPRMCELMGSELPGLASHRASCFTAETAKDADLILVMERWHKFAIVALVPQAAGKTMLLGHWLDEEKDIDDPYGLDEPDYRAAIERIRLAVASWQGRLSAFGS